MRRSVSAVMLSAIVACGVPGAATAATAGLPSQRFVPVALALDAAKAALAACAAKGFAVSASFVDRRGELMVLAADPAVSPISVELSQRKARTAALFNSKSGDVGARFRASPGYGQAMSAVDPRLSGAQGAVPVVVGGELLGALGISGAPDGASDEACVAAGLSAIAPQLR